MCVYVRACVHVCVGMCVCVCVYFCVCVLIRDAMMLRVGMLLSTGTKSAFRMLRGSMMILLLVDCSGGKSLRGQRC